MKLNNSDIAKLDTMVHIFCYARETILLFLIVPLAHAYPVSFHYPRFSKNSKDQPKLEGDAAIVDSDYVIRLTRYLADPDKASGVGRVRSPELIKLYDNITNQLYDFSAKFSFIIFSNHSKHGDGLAFFLASSKLPTTNQIGGGGGFGLMNAGEIAINSEYSFVAVEFDTHYNYWDPTNVNHVGVIVNSVVSNKHVEWSADVSKRKFYHCSIEYSSRNKNLNVSFTGKGFNEEQEEQRFSHTIDLREYLPEDVIVGISASTGAADEEHMLRSWSFSTRYGDAPEKKNNIACGKKAIHYQELEDEVSLVEWVWELYGLKKIIAAADPKLCGQFDVKELEYLLVVGLWCANPDNTSRPSIKKVIKALNFEVPLPILPQNMPSLASLSATTSEQFLPVFPFFRSTG
ncbi:hypothetical protein TSUD_85460 [Trifolium subterraneum]|uniref:Legume lectin domain-containing protein n=1 Tax=Trifolium subterraneum TaxID=3900 RepID=A0A2Z6PHP9_TRISU|nr:hypothetical protein TSUD_85460 [Trifolium subterraneum]